MKVLLINGSPHKNGSTYVALREVETALNNEGIETSIVWLGTDAISGCIACGFCSRNGKCVKNDIVNEFAERAKNADGFVFGTPVHYAGASGAIVSFLDRLFYFSKGRMAGKIGASVVSCGRGGATAAFDRLNKYFGISNMHIAGSQYWNQIHGNTREEALQDAEGLQTARTQAENMVFLMRSIALGKEKYGLPEKEKSQWTNFIR